MQTTKGVKLNHAAANVTETAISISTSEDFISAAHNIEPEVNFSHRPCGILGFQFSDLQDLQDAEDSIQFAKWYNARNIQYRRRSVKINNEPFHMLFVYIGGATKPQIMDNVSELRAELRYNDMANFTMGSQKAPELGMMVSAIRGHPQRRPN